MGQLRKDSQGTGETVKECGPDAGEMDINTYDDGLGTTGRTTKVNESSHTANPKETDRLEIASFNSERLGAKRLGLEEPTLNIQGTD